MRVIVITGCGGLVGSECVRFFTEKGYFVVGIDNNMREYFFGKEGSVEWVLDMLKKEAENFKCYNVDIREAQAIEEIFKEYSSDIKAIIHTAAQPSHDWAARNAFVDFTVNANGTLVLLENFRKYAPQASFIFTSTNKVYGDTVNYLPLRELDTRYELDGNHPYYEGIDEGMSIDNTRHSLFGASKLAGDIFVQEYGKYFRLKTVSFRAGCITGSFHSSVVLHGFLHYLMKCVVSNRQYIIFGCKGKQVRDNIHSFDLTNAFHQFILNPKEGKVYNIGGGRTNSCSILEAAELCEKITEKKLSFTYVDEPRIGDHKWWISSFKKFKTDYPTWSLTYNLQSILQNIFDGESRKEQML